MNEYLISAAADLLAACEALVSDEMLKAHETIEFGPGGTTWEEEADALIERNRAAARAAIAKAKGEA